MKSMKFEASSCSRCSHYTPEGRRGGHCSQLGVPVQGKWKACSLSVPVFLTPLPDLTAIDLLPTPIEVHLPDTRLDLVEAPLHQESPALKVPL